MSSRKALRGLCEGFVGMGVLAAAVTLATAWARSAASRAPRSMETGLPSAPSMGQAAPAVLETDKGTFRILVAGRPAGKEEFELSQNSGKWIAREVSDITSGSTNTRVTGTLELRPDATPLRYQWSTQGAKKASATVVFEGSTATSELHLENAQPFTQQFTFPSARIAILDNNLNYQYAVLAHLYDWSKKGAQTFSVLVPQELTPGTATAESLGKQEVSGKSFDELRVKTEDNEIDLYLEGGRLMRIGVPGANAEIIRE